LFGSAAHMDLPFFIEGLEMRLSLSCLGEYGVKKLQEVCKNVRDCWISAQHDKAWDNSS
jgi:hypothetical protein